MFSFFKRKKKPETPETAPEQNAQPVETAESAPAITPPEHTHTEPGHIPVTVAEFEQPQPLSEHARETVAADAATHPVSRFAHDIAHPEAPAAATLAPDAPETAPEVAERPSEAEAAPAITPHIDIHTEPGHIPVAVAEFERPQPLSEHAREAVAEDAAGHPVSQLVADVVGGSDKLPEQFDPEAPVGRIHVPQHAPEAAPAELSGHAAADALKQADSIATVAAAVPVAAAAEQAAAEEPAKPGWAARLKQGLTKSRDQMAKSLAGVFGGGQIDEDLYEELETVLITSDMGIEATDYLMKDVRKRVSLKGLKDGNELRGALKDAIYELIKPLEQPLEIPARKEPFVIMLAGINGAGKTTSIGKLAKYFQSQGKSVLLAAGDTFRAAAREQLQEWGARNNVTVISQASGDSAAVCFDAVEAAKARGIDIVLADTAGRLPTQLHLMEEIKKVKRVLQKSLPDAPHEIIVVLDANIGQNAVNQVVAFDDALGLTGLIVTKLDGTAKGGVLAALASSRPIPVRYIGVGEKIDDLRPFDARAFVDALLD
ncbi:signal recognition particle-docking protein FtsY [Uruburuella suis]|uniref:signal recognition particle-docking protein FtsY n=1 Tax=Uruburuella suis TaxID=252130 RepID=UPI003F4AB509